MNTNDDNNDNEPMEQPGRTQPEPELPRPPEPRKSMEIRGPDANMPHPPPPMLSVEDVPDEGD